MQVINLTFRADSTPDERQQTLDQIRRIEEVTAAAFLRPGSKSAAIQRMAYARAHDSAALGRLVEKIRRLPAVETADVPAARSLKTDW